MSRVEVAQTFRAARQYVGEFGLSFRRAGVRRASRPLERGIEVGLAHLVGFEQAALFAAADVDQAVNAEPGQQGLRFEMAALGRALEPSRAFRPTCGHAKAAEIAQRDLMLGFRQPAFRRMGVERKSLRVAAELAQPGRPAQGGGRRNQGEELLDGLHGRLATPLDARSTLGARPRS